eukprot:3783393-Pleurochrysis_carterae.AAC.2
MRVDGRTGRRDVRRCSWAETARSSRAPASGHEPRAERALQSKRDELGEALEAKGKDTRRKMMAVKQRGRRVAWARRGRTRRRGSGEAESEDRGREGAKRSSGGNKWKTRLCQRTCGSLCAGVRPDGRAREKVRERSAMCVKRSCRRTRVRRVGAQSCKFCRERHAQRETG